MYRNEQDVAVMELLTKCPLQEYLSTVPKECPFKGFWNQDIDSKVKYIENMGNVQITYLLRVHNACEKKLLDAIKPKPMDV